MSEVIFVNVANLDVAALWLQSVTQLRNTWQRIQNAHLRN